MAAETEGASGLTPRAATLRKELEAAFGSQSLGGFEPGGVSTGHIEGSAHYAGRAIDVFFRPYDDPENTKDGWALAHWLVANADRLAIATVIYDDHLWSAGRSSEGWRPYVPSDQSEDPGHRGHPTSPRPRPRRRHPGPLTPRNGVTCPS